MDEDDCRLLDTEWIQQSCRLKNLNFPRLLNYQPFPLDDLSREEFSSVVCFMGMIVSGTAGLFVNRSVKKPVTEERRLPVCLTGLPVSEAVRNWSIFK